MIERVKQAAEKNQLTELIKESRSKQYSVEILAAFRMVEKFNDEETAVQTLREVHKKAVAENNAGNELSAIYGILTTLQKSVPPNPELLTLAERGIELAKTWKVKDALALLQSQKASILQLILIHRQNRWALRSAIMGVTGGGPALLSELSQEELTLRQIAEDFQKAANETGAHAFQSGDLRVIGTVMMQQGFTTGIIAFSRKAFHEDYESIAKSAETLLEESNKIFGQVGDKNLLAYSENNIATYWWMMGDSAKAEFHAKAALVLSQACENKSIIAKAAQTLQDLRTGLSPHF